jgi:hypothetical protein
MDRLVVTYYLYLTTRYTRPPPPPHLPQVITEGQHCHMAERLWDLHRTMAFRTAAIPLKMAMKTLAIAYIVSA